MMMQPKTYSRLGLLAIVAMSFVLLGCPADSPTAPGQSHVVPDGGESTDWGVSVAAQPTTVNSGSVSVVTVKVRRNSDGALPPDKSTVLVSTDLGMLGLSASKIVSAILMDGMADVLFTAGLIPGQANIVAQLEASEGQATINIIGPKPFFIESVSPSNGPTVGGNTVTIRGVGFESPLRVFFGTVPGDVKANTSNQIKVVAPPGTTGFVDVKVTRNFTTEPETTALGAGYQYADPI
jgi:hypothetical protein